MSNCIRASFFVLFGRMSAPSAQTPRASRLPTVGPASRVSACGGPLRPLAHAYKK